MLKKKIIVRTLLCVIQTDSILKHCDKSGSENVYAERFGIHLDQTLDAVHAETPEEKVQTRKLSSLLFLCGSIICDLN